MEKLLLNKSLFDYLSLNELAFLVLLFIFIFTYYLIPRLLGVIRYKNLMDDPNERSSHSFKTPTLGGVSFFMSLMIGLFVVKSYDKSGFGMSLVAALTILFMVGLKDDLVVLSARAKVLAQIAASLFVVFQLDKLNLNGLGIQETGGFLNLILQVFFILLVINAVNLIDGIDGFAALSGILIFTILGLFFYFLGENYFFLLALINIGFLGAFLRFNISKRHKIFMGDTGSMIIGFLIALSGLRFLSLDESVYALAGLNSEDVIFVLTSVLFIPLLDVLRVMVIRISHGRSPFSADRNHMHHILVDNGLSHIRASIFLVQYGLLISLSCYFLSLKYGSGILFIFLSLLALGTVHLFFVFNNNPIAKQQKKRIKELIPTMWLYLHNYLRSGANFVLRTFL